MGENVKAGHGFKNRGRQNKKRRKKQAQMEQHSGSQPFVARCTQKLSLVNTTVPVITSMIDLYRDHHFPFNLNANV